MTAPLEPERTAPPIPQAPDVELRRWEFTGGSQEVSAARRAVEETLQAHDWAQADIDDALLILSELAADAVRHARTDFAVTAWVDGVASIAVSDSDVDGDPTVQARAPGQVGSMGLFIVAALSTRWGVDKRPEGKSVWFEIDPRDKRPN